MKKFLAIFMLLFAIGMAKAQQTVTNNASSRLKVTSYVRYDLKQTKYRIKLTVREETYADQWGKIATIDELKSGFYDSLAAKGIDTSKFKDSPTEYALASYYDKGTILTYETINRKELETILTIQKPKNVGLMTVEVYCQTSKGQYKKLVTKGLEKSDAKARTIARQMGKSLGELKLIEDNFRDDGEWVHLRNPYDRWFALTTTYNLN